MGVTSTERFGTLHQIVGDCEPGMTPADFLSELADNSKRIQLVFDRRTAYSRNL